MDFPAYTLDAPPILTPFHMDSLGMGLAVRTTSLVASTASATWPVNNKAYFYPFRLHTIATAYQLLFYVGATSSGNIDVGIYDSEKNRIVSAGTTAMSASVNALQEINITDTVLGPGEYLLGVACSTTAGTAFLASIADESLLCIVPVYEQTTALPLPDPAVPVLCTDGLVPLVACGIQFRSLL